MADIRSEIVGRIAEAAASATPLRIVGAGTKAFFGRAIEGEPLEVAGHSGIVEYAPQELVLTARAGTPLVEIEAALAEHGQVLAFEPPRLERATLGGALACNTSGPARPWAGSIRDAVLGVALVNGRGEALKFGGRVMKNVAGFDVSRLQAGALGAFGVLTEITIKVLPAPAATETRAYTLEADEAIRHMSEIARAPLPLTGAAWVDGCLYLRLAGAAQAVTAAARALGGDRPDDGNAFWERLREQRVGVLAGDAPVWRFSVNSAAALPGLDEHALIDWGGAQRFVAGELDRDAAQARAAGAGGHAALYRGGDRGAEVHHALPAPLRRLHSRLKSAFDPEGILNSGRLYSWL